MKPKAVEEKTEEVAKVVDIQPELVARPKPVFKPTMKPKSVEEKTEETDRGTDSHPEPTISKENTDSGEVKPRPKPVFKPIMRPKKEE